MGYVSDFVIGVLSNATFALIVFVVAYVNRRWIKRQLMKWTLSGDVWWFCCDLHSVKLQSNLGRYDKVGVAIDAALRHARTLGVDKDIVVEIQALKEIDPADHPSLRGRVDALIDRCGKLAILNQPGFES